MDQGYKWTSELIPHPNEDGIPWLILRRVPAPTSPNDSSSGSSTSDSDTSSLLGDTMDQCYKWTSEVIPHPDEDGIPRLILRRVSAPSSTSDSHTSSLLGDTMDQCYKWTSEVIPHPDEDGIPRLILQRVSAPSSTSDSHTSSLLGDTMDQGYTRTSELIPHPDEDGIPRCDPEVSPSDPPPAPGKPVEAFPPEGPAAPGKIKSLPGGPKPRWVQNLFRMMNQVGSIRRKRTAKPEGESSGKRFCSNT